MFTYIYEYVHIYMYVCVCVCACVCVYEWQRSLNQKCTRIRDPCILLYIFINMFIYICMYNMYVHICMYNIYVHICICACVCVYVCVCVGRDHWRLTKGALEFVRAQGSQTYHDVMTPNRYVQCKGIVQLIKR